MNVLSVVCFKYHESDLLSAEDLSLLRLQPVDTQRRHVAEARRPDRFPPACGLRSCAHEVLFPSLAEEPQGLSFLCFFTAP